MSVSRIAEGVALTRVGRFDQAGELFEAALRADPSNREALTWMAVVRKGQGRVEESIDLLERSLALGRDAPDALNLLGINLLAVGRAQEAEQVFRELSSLQPEAAPVYANLGMSLRLQNRGAEALEAFQTALRLDPAQVLNHFQVFKQFQQLSRWDEALGALEAGLERYPDSIQLLEALALAHGRLGRQEEAESTFKRIYRQSASAANSYATWLQEQGRFDESVPVLAESLRINPIQGAPYRNLVEAKQFELAGRPILETALRLVEDPGLDQPGKMHLAYALGALNERKAEYEVAMRWFDEANAIAYRTYPACRTFDAKWTEREPERLSELYSRDFLDRLAGLGNPDARPIFIVGMIRSGTTLLDQIVSSHPDVASVGEATFWNTVGDDLKFKWRDGDALAVELETLGNQYVESVGVDDTVLRFTDKMPLNFRHVGLIHAVFPNAKVLHIRRDAFDTCLSIYTTFFAGGPNFAYNKENIVTFYRAYLRTMEHWRAVLQRDRFLEVDYEVLVREAEPTTRDVIDFLGLTWDEACLRHEANSRQISTPSRWQARQQIYTTSMGKRPKFAEFAEIFCEL